ncbi:MAG: tRNA 2-thiouridine(34) synthase MnmA [Cyclobacteriaceae bacterium]|nr:tRNA 2-thiouridine(34) synthase MnmA [Cyclobacteriaceae bacterium]MCB0498187.1 tRNA 2-thiouridine(34) synthase MnmA [Cyclobacteriaceae bacterium]MCB9238911.1 tRNA 2-thiouridine(34) synthase MnmA [Flammeovirgaceae bacterium]MCO5270630.1 tRNA 2-thiouridine(34) synthase MnmA [Cyclobacteriaceae bacterium]MCW5900929.1 tRNA 2-thiouridine(34) synthase MnmA [Cyclobacteriaceae bacterium]
MAKKVVVGLSGGVDSSVAAYLLKGQGYEVIGMFMKNWHDDSVTLSNECPWLDDSNDAMIVAQHLGIPFQTIDLSTEYKKRIVDYMFAEYQRGRTPNPDVLCNREIKFDIFLKAAMKLGADFVATGHYCRKDEQLMDGKTIHRLLAGKDSNKDQSYFLCQLTQAQLAKALFPIGELTKPEVRAIARKMGLATADKKDSQGLCFIGKVHLPDFLQQKLKAKKGKVIEIPRDAAIFDNGTDGEDYATLVQPYHLSPGAGHVVGEHNGAHFYTIGQRKGLNMGGFPKPMFVIGTDTGQNLIYMGQGEDHPGLYRKGLFVRQGDEHWVRTDLALGEGESKRYKVRIRYRQPLENANLIRKKEGTYVVFDHPQRGVAPGQFATWYEGDELIGSGVIN